MAKWRHAEATFNMLQFGLRLGERPRQVVTTTPRPNALLFFMRVWKQWSKARVG